MTRAARYVLKAIPDDREDMVEAIADLTTQLVRCERELRAKQDWINEAMPDMREGIATIQFFMLLVENIRREINPWINCSHSNHAARVLAERLNDMLPPAP